MPEAKRRRPLVTINRIFICAGDHPSGSKLFIRRGLGLGRRRSRRGIAIGKANERELAYIKEHMPDLYRLAYPSAKAESEAKPRGRPRKESP